MDHHLLPQQWCMELLLCASVSFTGTGDIAASKANRSWPHRAFFLAGETHSAWCSFREQHTFRSKTVMYMKGLAPSLAHIDVKLMAVVILTVINIMWLVFHKPFNNNYDHRTFIEHLIWTNCYAKHLISQQPYEVDTIISLIWDVGTEARAPHCFQGNVQTPHTWVLQAFHDLALLVSPSSCLADLVVPCLFTLILQGSAQASPPPGGFPWPWSSPFPDTPQAGPRALPMCSCHPPLMVLTTQDCSHPLFAAHERMWVLWREVGASWLFLFDCRIQPSDGHIISAQYTIPWRRSALILCLSWGKAPFLRGCCRSDRSFLGTRVD